MGVKLNRSGLAEHMGVSLPTVDRWVKEGMPVVQRGARGVEWSFDLADVIRWWGDRKAAAAAGEVDDLSEIEKRTAKAKMEQVELALAEAKALVAPISEFERAQASMMAAIRQNVMNVPQRAVLQLLGETNETTFKQKLRAELVIALEQAAAADLTPPDEDKLDEDGDDETS
ncbi:terminase small subunit [Klebsiella pneumoniae]|uniref:terminase small subunit n=3 Tax=Enterobacteriaceae TaxID=543 RepID=UPI001FF20528|nr:terminase small subunit [Klebsiella pneumoniae]UOV84349.1 terminase small subunit [Klebsiella pneumoniae]